MIRDCTTCKYSRHNGASKNCYTVVGSCSYPDLPKWAAAPEKPTPRKCATCLYDALGFDTDGIKRCKHLIGVCGYSNNLQGWKPINDNEGFNPELYMPTPRVMPDEKEYMDFEGVV